MMKLSEAIRLGAMMKPQAYTSTRNQKKSCALQAAADAVGIPRQTHTTNTPYAALAQQWPLLHHSSICPVCGVRCTRDVIIFHLNDEHRWTRERIADWVEQFEQQQEAVTTAPTTTEVPV